MQIRGIRADRAERELELAYVTAEIGEEPIAEPRLPWSHRCASRYSALS